MKILITNDDGIFAPGIIELAKVLAPANEVTLVAPIEQQSGKSHAITLRNKLEVLRIELDGLENVVCYSVSGTPADCACLGVRNICTDADVIFSGINMGENSGTDVYYSGTIGAAVEGALCGLPAIAVSLCSHTDTTNLPIAAMWGKRGLDYMFSGINGVQICDVLSINVPNIAADKMLGARLAPLCRNVNSDYKFISENSNEFIVPPWNSSCNDECDVGLLNRGHVTFTPISLMRCDLSRLGDMNYDFNKKLLEVSCND